jgi:hypothetical protein
LIASSAKPAGSVPWPAFGAIAAISFVACAALDLFFFKSSTTFGDERRFLQSAAGIVRDFTFRVREDVAWEMPGTAVFYAPFLALFPDHFLMAIRLAQALLVAAQSILVGALAVKLFE